LGRGSEGPGTGLRKLAAESRVEDIPALLKRLDEKSHEKYL
jgi:hypothetical protein